MRIVSLNAWGGAVFDELSDWLPCSSADVLCLQEVTRTPGLGGWTHFADDERALRQRANLFEDVRGVLPDHQGLFLTSDAGPVLDINGRVHRQDFGLAVFVDQKIPVIGYESCFVHRSFVDHDEWTPSGRPRIAQGVRVIDRESKRTMTIVHLHGLRDINGKHDTPERQVQAEQLASLVSDLRQPDDVTVVCGDMNLLPDSETFDILRSIGLVNLVGTAHTRTSHYRKEVRHANYLLTSAPDAVKSFEIIENPEVSDHRPLVLDM